MFAERDRITIRENCGLNIRPSRRPGPTAPIWLRPSQRDHVQSSCLAADRASVGGPIAMITSVDAHVRNDAWSTSRCGSGARRHRSLRKIEHSSCHVTALLQCARSRSYCPPRSRMAWAKWREEPVHRTGIATERRPRGQPGRHVEGRAAGLRGGRHLREAELLAGQCRHTRSTTRPPGGSGSWPPAPDTWQAFGAVDGGRPQVADVDRR